MEHLIVLDKSPLKKDLQLFFKGALSNTFRGVGAALVLVLYDEI